MLFVLSAGIAGVSSHLCWFIHGEHDLYAGRYAQLFLGLSVSAYIIGILLSPQTRLQAIISTTCVLVTYLGSLFASIVLYRIAFARTRHIRGPFTLKISKLFHLWSIRRFNNFKFLHSVHQKYGDIVRTGPNEVTFFTPEAFHQIYGPESTCKKTVFYGGTHPLISLIGSREPLVHARFRKVWDQAFSIKALDHLEPTVVAVTTKLLYELEKRIGHSLNLPEWLERYTFDLMGLFGFNHDFNLLQGEESIALRLFEGGRKSLGMGGALPWLKHLGFALPPIRKRYDTLVEWAIETLDKRLSRESTPHEDIMSYIISDVDATEGRTKGRNRLIGDLMLILAAGSDPMVQCLSNLGFYLSKEPHHIQKILSELSKIDPGMAHRDLQYLPHLNACIYEALRLNPPVPAAGLRTIPEGGLVIHDTYIPAGTTVIVPQYSLSRRVDCFVQPNSFIPERFTTQPELILDRSAWNPWSAGRYNCVGKNLGLMEIRIAAAMLISRFEWDLSKGEDGKRMFNEARDYFTMVPGPLQVVFRPRKL